MASFLKDRKLVEEGYKVEDLLDFSSEINRLDSSMKEMELSSVVGYVGRFGSGKSTVIYQLQKRYEADKDTKWFEFDAWKYPERRELWEGFALDIADQLGSRKRIQKSVDGKETKSALVDTATDVIGAGMEMVGGIAESASGALGKAAEKLQIADKIVGIFKKSPAKRVFQIQELLEGMLSSLKEKRICIVIEDIDRSGDAGQYFLETLRQFIKNNCGDKEIIIIVPIGTEVYSSPAHSASYHKTLDYTLFFEPRGIDYSNYIDAVFDQTAFPESFQKNRNVTDKSLWNEHLKDWFRLATSNKLTIREMKSIIRSADLAYSNLVQLSFEPDPRVVLGFQLLNNINTEGGSRWITRIGTANPINNSCPVSTYLQAIGANASIESFGKHWNSSGIRLVNPKDLPIPRFIANVIREEDQGWSLSDFYLVPFGQKVLPKQPE